MIPNFIDPARFEAVRGQPAPGAGRKPGEKVLVHISNFRPVKRVIDVLDVFLGVREAMPARLLLVGDGPDRAKVEERCRRSGCCDAVIFLGNMPAVEEVLVGADLFLLPSESGVVRPRGARGAGLRGAGRRARAGGMPEVVRDGVDGLLYPVGDVDAMAAGRIALLADAARHAALRPAGARGRRRALRPGARSSARYRALYERVLARHAPEPQRLESGRPATRSRVRSATRGPSSASRARASSPIVAPARRPSRRPKAFLADAARASFPDATHHCFAWRLGWPPAERAADAGEPAGTAGQPILRALRGAGLTDVVVVVVRWFGGTKLGKGGLARAYAGATPAGARDAADPARAAAAAIASGSSPTTASRRRQAPAPPARRRARERELLASVATPASRGRCRSSAAASSRSALAELGIAPRTPEGDDALE